MKLDPMIPRDTMTIREMCDTYEVTPRTLRFYEAKELLAPVRDRQKRLFTQRDRARLKLILRGKRFGFSLEQIRQLLDLYDTEDGAHSQMLRAHDLSRERLAEMIRERDDLNATISELSRQIDWLAHELAARDTTTETVE